MYKVRIFFCTNNYWSHAHTLAKPESYRIHVEGVLCLHGSELCSTGIGIQSNTALECFRHIFLKKKKEKKSFVRRIEELTIGYSAKYIYIYMNEFEEKH